MGELDISSVTQRDAEKKTVTVTPSDGPLKPELRDIISLNDFEAVALTSLSRKSWAFVSSGANDNLTRNDNVTYLQRVWLRPAIMRNVGTSNTRTNLFGCELEIPIYIAPVGAAKAVCEEGELALAGGAAKSGIIQCIATTSSYPLREILDTTPTQAFFQLYVNKDREASERLIRQATLSGKVKAIFVTADLPVMSKREADERTESTYKNADMIAINKRNAGTNAKTSGLAKSNSSFIDPTFNWQDLQWLRHVTSLPILVKGIQRAEDARIAMELGFDGIVIGNHGGRAADTAPPAIVILLEVHRNCPEVFQRMKVLVDGGFRRGSDVLKALCLGASAVGFGRPFMYALSYGQEGLEHAVNSMCRLPGR